ncbi:hypothetical protein LZ32DRAFT_656369 [Colletotrichum eremochloae]|nr:hypothetical protein LZ32DRAFT_656369 [Colletotrichum eremochloae]
MLAISSIHPGTSVFPAALAGFGLGRFLVNGSLNKPLRPECTAVCVALAEASVTGTSRILEGYGGFHRRSLQKLTPQAS